MTETCKEEYHKYLVRVRCTKPAGHSGNHEGHYHVGRNKTVEAILW